jgi:sodium-dependent dicarboxylate transporter 2/3/5
MDVICSGSNSGMDMGRVPDRELFGVPVESAFSAIAASALQRLPLVLLFCGGYLVYRLMVVTRATDAFVFWALRRSRGNPRLLILYIIGAAAALSAFIPNAITVLTLLPVLCSLDTDFRDQGVGDMTTPLMISAIYGAGIGGMATMIGTPANAVLLVALDVLDVPGRESITFFNWFLWSLPLVVLMVVAAWFTAGVLGLPSGAGRLRLTMRCVRHSCDPDPRQKRGVGLFLLFMGFWMLEALARAVFPEIVAWSPLACGLFSLVFLWLLFLWRVRGEKPLLAPRDVVSGVPGRGLLFLGLLVLVFTGAHLLGLDELAAEYARQGLSLPMPGWLVMFLSVLCVIFLTEILSNTVVVAGFFMVVHVAAQAHALDPLPLMIAVSVASTCAFMTPVATPSNALAFGEMPGARLRAMLVLGAFLNVAGAVIMSAWLGFILPLVYG